MDKLSLLTGRPLELKCGITVLHPTPRFASRIGEENYFGFINTITAIPTDFRLPLHRSGMDAEEMTDFELFLFTYQGLDPDVCSIMFDGLNLQEFYPEFDERSQQIVLRHKTDDLVIDQFIHHEIVSFLAQIHAIEKKRSKSANEHTKNFLIEMEKLNEQAKAAQKKREPFASVLTPLISSVAISTGFSYDECLDMPMYRLFETVKRIQRYMRYDYLMQGISHGTIEQKKIKPSDYDWMEPL